MLTDIFEGISNFVSDAYYDASSVFDSGGSSDSTFNYTSSDDYDDDPSAEVLGFYEMGDMGQDLSAYSSTPTYQESLYEDAGGDLYYGGEYDNRSYAKQAQDYLYKTLGVGDETINLIAQFAGAAGKALTAGDNRGDGGGGSARSQRPATPTGRQLGTTRPDKPGIARTAQLAGLSQRAAAAMTAMQKNQFGSGETSLAEMIASQGATTPKGQTIANPRGVRNLNVKQTQFV